MVTIVSPVNAPAGKSRLTLLSLVVTVPPDAPTVPSPQNGGGVIVTGAGGCVTGVGGGVTGVGGGVTGVGGGVTGVGGGVTGVGGGVTGVGGGVTGVGGGVIQLDFSVLVSVEVYVHNVPEQ